MTAPTTMRASCAGRIAEVVRETPDVLTVGADGHALFSQVIAWDPSRYVEVGIAESNLVGVAAGLARAGWRPVVGAMAPFLVRRAYEQLRLDVSLPGLPVVLLGVGGGLSYGSLGPTHHAVDDLALMAALPSMDLYCPADAVDAAEVLRRILPPTRPAYVRLTARQDPAVFATRPVGDPREVRLVREPADARALVLATGRCVAEAIAAAEELSLHGTEAAVGVVTCLRPFPAEQVRELATRWPVVVTAAEALPQGGLGERTAEAVRGLPVRIVRLAVDDRYPPVADHEELLAFYRLDRTAIASGVLHALSGRSVQ
ncbi:transketolase C-terminal domain-containing protein [Lentzea sp. CA-135723]|uniref:transketolase C-terminal domain-containing protein n=1 Tax=Lentzea sp. CA-135723 TaxID=3239950 RepID=UPI003D8D5940